MIWTCRLRSGLDEAEKGCKLVKVVNKLVGDCIRTSHWLVYMRKLFKTYSAAAGVGYCVFALKGAPTPTIGV